MTTSDRLAGIVPAFASALGDAVAALLGESTTTATIVNGGQASWTVSIAVTGAIAGTVVVGFPEEDGRRVSALVRGSETDPDDEAVLDTLREICSHAAGSVSRKDVAAGTTFSVTDVIRAETPALEAQHAFEFPVRESRVRLFVHATLVESAVPADAAAEDDGTSHAGEQAVEAPVGGAAAVSTQNLDVLLDVELPVSVRFGQTELPLNTLARLGPGSVVDLRRTPDEPVDVMVSGKVIARGEVVVVDGNYGVRVLEIVSAAERIRSLGA